MDSQMASGAVLWLRQPKAALANGSVREVPGNTLTGAVSRKRSQKMLLPAPTSCCGPNAGRWRICPHADGRHRVGAGRRISTVVRARGIARRRGLPTRRGLSTCTGPPGAASTRPLGDGAPSEKEGTRTWGGGRDTRRGGGEMRGGAGWRACRRGASVGEGGAAAVAPGRARS